MPAGIIDWYEIAGKLSCCTQPDTVGVGAKGDWTPMPYDALIMLLL